jgi:exosome complex component RRP4
MEKRIVIPGELVTEERRRLGDHVFLKEGKVYSDVLGIAESDEQTASVVPLHGKYMPRSGDLIVGIISGDVYSGYIVDINSFYNAFISKKELRDPLKVGTVVSAKIEEVNEVNDVQLSNIRVFYGGEILTVAPVKVPRMIGKNGSMLEVLKKGTSCNLLIGRNGRIWIKGGNYDLLVEAISKIEREAHLANLTNKVTLFLEEKNKVLKEAK